MLCKFPNDVLKHIRSGRRNLHTDADLQPKWFTCHRQKILEIKLHLGSASDAKLISREEFCHVLVPQCGFYHDNGINLEWTMRRTLQSSVVCGWQKKKRVGHLSDNLILNVWINRIKCMGTNKQFSYWLKWARAMNETNECRVSENDFIASNKMRWSLSVVSRSVMNLLITQNDVYLHIPNACVQTALWNRPTCPGVHTATKHKATQYRMKTNFDKPECVRSSLSRNAFAVRDIDCHCHRNFMLARMYKYMI